MFYLISIILILQTILRFLEKDCLNSYLENLYFSDSIDTEDLSDFIDL